MYKYHHSILAVSAMALLAGAGHAQTAEDSERETITITGSATTFGVTKSDAPILETARSVSIETADMFIEKGALTLDDVLGYTAGVTGEAFGFATRGDFYSIRGLDAPEYRDNIQSLFGNYNNTRPEIYTLSQVDVLKGPASVLFGQGSPGGLVNTVSKIAGEGLENELVLSYGSHNRTEVATDLNAALSDTLFVRFVALYRDSDTQVDFVEDNALIFAPSITWQPNSDTSLTLLINHDDRDSDTAHQFLPINGTLLAPADAPYIDASTYHGEPGFNTYDTESTAVTVIGTHAINEVFTLEGTARYRDGDSDYSQTWISFTGTADVPRIDASGNGLRSWYDAPASSRQLAADIRLRAQFATGDIEHEVLAGVNYQDVDLTASAAFIYGSGVLNAFNPIYGNGQPTAAMFDAVRSDTSTGSEYTAFYINDQISIGALKLNAGIRFDSVETQNGTGTQDDDATSLAFGALYAFENGISPYISYAESFEPVIGTDAVTGNLFNPEEGEQIEIGIKYQPSSNIFVTLAWFDLEVSNLPNPAGLPNAPSQQEGITSITGLELEFLSRFDASYGQVGIEFNASQLDTEDPNGLSQPSVPEFQASLWGTLSPTAIPELNLGAGIRHIGENKSWGVNPFISQPVQIVTESVTLTDLLISYDFDRATLALNVRNLFDEEYNATCLARGDCFPGEERTINLRLSTQF